MKTTYWKALPETSEKMRALRDTWFNKAIPAIDALKVEVGATDCVVNMSPLGLWWVMGFKFDPSTAVDRTLFKRIKALDNTWKPKAGTELEKRLMEEFTFRWVIDCRSLLGIQEHDSRMPAMHFNAGDAVLVEWSPSAWTFDPVGCERISDLEFDALITTSKKED